MSTVQDFLETILPFPLGKGKMSVFLLPGGKNAWFDNAVDAAVYAEQHNGKSNVYFSLSAFENVKSGRGKEEDAIALIAVGIDIDIAGNVHTKDNLPRSQEEAMSFVDLAFPGIRPTIITNSGHGLQCFYVFKEPWYFEDEGDKVAAKQLCSDIRHNYQYHMGKEGYTLDATFDLARIMRVAGTLNIKDMPVQSIIVEKSGRYYTPADFENLIINEQRKPIKSIVKSGDGSTYNLTLNSEAVPNKAKMVGLMDDSDFMHVWEKLLDNKLKARLKANGDEGDCSLSIYDLMLANKAVRADWTPQEIADLIIAFRRKHSKDPNEFQKAMRMDYMERTIKKAYEGYTKIMDSKEIKRVARELKILDAREKAGEKISPEEKAQKEGDAYNIVSGFFNGKKFKILRKYISDPPEYEVLFQNGERIHLGSSKELMNQHTLCSKVFDTYGKMPDTLKKEDFTKFLNFMGRRIEIVHTSPETRETDRMSSWINEYLSGLSVSEDRHSAFNNGHDPFKEGGQTYLFGHKLRNYIYANYGERLGSKQFGLVMKRLGCSNKLMNFYKVDSTKTSATVYDITQAVELPVDEMVN